MVQIYVTVKGSNAANAKVWVGGVAYDLEQYGNAYRVYLPGMSITELDTPVTIELKVGDDTVHTVTYGVYAYVYQMGNSTDATMKELAQALYDCAVAAKAYN